MHFLFELLMRYSSLPKVTFLPTVEGIVALCVALGCFTLDIGSYRSEGMTRYDAVQVLVIWKYMQSNWEAKRLCEEDAKRFLSARYRPWELDAIGIYLNQLAG